MREKIELFAFISIFFIIAAKILMENADEDGNIYIKHPKDFLREIKSGYKKTKHFFDKK